MVKFADLSVERHGSQVLAIFLVVLSDLLYVIGYLIS